MRRTLDVIRLQLINRQTFLWVPLIIIAGTTVLSILIFALIPTDGPKYSGAGQAPLWYFFAIGITAMTYTFPFSQAMSITRREFFLGTMLTAILGSALMGGLFLIGGAIEQFTDGYGMNGWMFYIPWMWASGAAGAFACAFAFALLMFVVGFTGATIYKRWGPLAVTLTGVCLGVVLVALVFFTTKLELWGRFAEIVGALGAGGVALWGLVVIAALMGISFLSFRRTTP